MEYTVEEYNKKKELAESGNLDAICDLGYLYYYGFGNTAPDIDKGVYYWCTAANLGNAVAQDKSFHSPDAKRESSFKSLFLRFSIKRYKYGMFFF